MHLHKIIGLFPHKEINHQFSQPTILPQFVVNSSRVLRRRDAVVFFAEPRHLINYRVPKAFNTQAIGQRIEPDQPEVRRALSLQLFVPKILSVDPLHKKVEIVKLDIWKAQGF